MDANPHLITCTCEILIMYQIKPMFSLPRLLIAQAQKRTSSVKTFIMYIRHFETIELTHLIIQNWTS